MLAQHVAFLLLVVGTDVFFGWLSAVNVRHGATAVRERREWVDERLAVDDVDELLEYQRAKTGFSLLRSAVGLVVLLGVLYSGLFADAVAAVDALDPSVPALDATLVEGVVLVAGGALAMQAYSAPFDAFDTFVLEDLFGFNNQTPRLWVRDKLVGAAITVVLVTAIALPVLWAIEAFPTYWWAVGVALYLAFAVVMQVLLPRVLMPLFYEFDPVESGELRDAIDDVFDRAGFECEQIYEMDASRRSSHSNAFFSGFGRTKRVVLFDTLVDQMSIPEIQSVLAHELAHWKRSHIWKQLLASTVPVALTLAALWWFATQPWLYAMFGVAGSVQTTPAAGLLLGVLWVGPLNQFLSPLSNRLSLAHEREADTFAVDVMGDGQPMVNALGALASENLSNPFPHPLYETFHYDHPPIPERMQYIETYAAERATGEEPTDTDRTAASD
ncbi:M48 family metallopeptidase [Halorubellus sp. PRR65]|uniref:M48 family metallopeptidase n=1 Tax=Halorubellus sp. PRR65 TaxID=3098148 RepID=UPI002B25CCAA|nr:M48 family metallopeptidase [Halorubellus sp. PRR65]